MTVGKSTFNTLGKMMALGKNKTTKVSYDEAISLYKNGSYARAAQALESFIGTKKLRGHLARFYHARSCRLEAERLIEKNQFASAAQQLQSAVKYSTESCELIEFLAETYVRGENFNQASKSYKDLTSLNPNDHQLQIKKAMSYFMSGRGERAIETLEAVISQNPASFDLNYYLGTILAAEDQPHRSIGYLTKATQLRPESVDAHWKLGLAKGLTGHLVEAIHHLQFAHKLEPTNNWLLSQLSLAIAQANSQGMEIELKLESIEALPAEPDKTTQAMSQLSELILREPEFVTAFLDLPKTQMDEQIFSALLTIFIRSLEKHPEYADLHYHCSRVYERLGRADQAIEASQKALEVNPNYVTAMIHLAKLYAQTSQDQKAILRLNEAIERGADYADLHYLLGKLYDKQGALKEACLHYRSAIKINGKYRAAQDALALIEA